MKILFLQNKGKNFAGVGQVNKLVGEYLVKDGYDVSIISIRDNVTDKNLDYDPRIHVETINTKDLWGTYSFHEILDSLKKFNIIDFCKKLKHRINNYFTMKNDKVKLEQYINKYQPDYIITSHYQLLDMLPKDYLVKTFHEQHTSFKDSWEHPATKKTLLKYNGIVSYIWLSKKTMEDAIAHGLKNCIYIYNAVRFEEKRKADNIKNKKLVTIARLSRQKRIDIMVDIVNEVFKNKKYHDWKLEIYGDGEEYDLIKSHIKSKQIKLMGKTDNPKEVLLSSSINLNTSSFEGFSLSILEANECGIPTITFDFGESVQEEIIDGETGFIVKDQDDYINKLKMMMDNEELLNNMSKKVKDFNKKFKIENIVKEWEKYLK